MWHQQRIGRVTASNFHTFRTKAQTILNRKGHSDKKPVYSSLASSLLNKNDDVSHLPQINWGNAHEKDAIKSFMSDVASQHDGGPQGFKQCGLFIKPDYPVPRCFTRCLVLLQMPRPFNYWSKVPLLSEKWQPSCQGNIWPCWLPWRF